MIAFPLGCVICGSPEIVRGEIITEVEFRTTPFGLRVPHAFGPIAARVYCAEHCSSALDIQDTQPGGSNDAR